ncbi:uncharacterized protein [Periplaneta americana]|uniref:uncharacterized protein isoform X5 n=1 Tax=Periplaneta americana TaxID=6978 RepID=UPI0037E857E6
MDVIKMFPDIDPLAKERSIKTGIEEDRSLPQVEGNVLDLHLTGIKRECMHHSYDVKTGMTFDETPVEIPFPNLKGEAKEWNLSHLEATITTTECVDSSSHIKTEIKVEDTQVPVGFPILKTEVDEDLFDLDRVQQEQKVEVSSDDEVFSERLC